MKLKKLLAILLTVSLLCVSFSCVASAAAPEKTMFRCVYSNTSDENYMVQRIASELSADTSYTLTYKYHLASGGFANGGAGLYFGLFGHNTEIHSSLRSYGNKYLRMTENNNRFSGVPIFESVNVKGNTATYLFKLSADEMANITDYYIGFYTVKSAFDIYVADMVLYETSDSTMTNLLCDGDTATSLDNWYSFKSTGSGISSIAGYLPYNGDIFESVADKKTAHITINSPNDEDYIIQKTSELLEADTSYTVSYSYKLLEGQVVTSGAGLYIVLFGDNSTISSSKKGGDSVIRMTPNNGRYTTKMFESAIVHATDATFTFTLTEADVANMNSFYFGYYLLKANIDIYLADLTLYKTNDPNKTNLFANDVSSTDLKPWYRFFSAGNNLTSNMAYTDYDADMFVADKKMLHYNATISDSDIENHLVQNVGAKLKPNVSYTLAFDYHLDSSDMVAAGRGVYVGIFGDDSTKSFSTKNYANGYLRVRETGTRWRTPQFDSFDLGNISAEFTFTLTESQVENITKFYAGFVFVKTTVDMYLGDMVLYETADTEKTNLLENGKYDSNLNSWHTYNKTGTNITGIEYLDYDASLFAVPDYDTMLHINTTVSDDNCFIQKVSVPLKSDTPYTLSFKYNMEDGEFVNGGAGIYVGIFGHDTEMSTNTRKYGNHFIRMNGTRYTSSTFPKIKAFANTVIHDNTATYTFTLTDEAIANITDFYAGFHIVKDTVSLYISDMVLYESTDANKTNLLPCGKKTSDLNNWFSYTKTGAGLAAMAAYEPYDANKFVSANYADSNNDGFVDIIDFVQMKKDIASQAPYFVNSDINKDGAVDADDLTCVINELLSNETIIASPLLNTAKLLKNDKKLTIGYLGGSITLGTSAKSTILNGVVANTVGDMMNSWVNRTSAWFKNQYPDAQIETVNAGISGTGSNLALYRLGETLMNTDGHDMPDLVFVEFTSNDGTSTTCTAEDLRTEIESLIRNIRSFNPYAEIVIVSTNKSETAPAISAYREIAESYGIPFVNVGIPMQIMKNHRGVSNESNGSFYYTIDDLHPSSRGYALYTDLITNEVKYYLEKADCEGMRMCNREAAQIAPVYSNQINNPTLITADEFVLGTNTTVVDSPVTHTCFGTDIYQTNVVNLAPSYASVGNGGSITAEFSGTYLGFMFAMESSDIGLRYRIDGGEWKTFEVNDTSFSYKRFLHTDVFSLEHSLPDGEHTIEIENTISASFKLGAILANG